MTKSRKTTGGDKAFREKKSGVLYSCCLLNEFIFAIVGELVCQKTCRYFLPCADRLTESVDELLKIKGEPPTLIERKAVISDRAPRVVLILESPNVKEYDKVGHDSNGYIMGDAEPARGDTGINICDYFVQVLKRLNFGDWRIGLINPIPYSCSFGGHLSRNTKNAIFRKLITKCSFVESFKKRLEQMCNGRYILTNCCTYGNNKIIDRLLSSFGSKNYIRMSHPSSLKFKQQCCDKATKIEVFEGTKLPSKRKLDDALHNFAEVDTS